MEYFAVLKCEINIQFSELVTRNNFATESKGILALVKEACHATGIHYKETPRGWMDEECGPHGRYRCSDTYTLTVHAKTEKEYYAVAKFFDGMAALISTLPIVDDTSFYVCP